MLVVRRVTPTLDEAADVILGLISSSAGRAGALLQPVARTAGQAARGATGVALAPVATGVSVVGAITGTETAGRNPADLVGQALGEATRLTSRAASQAAQAPLRAATAAASTTANLTSQGITAVESAPRQAVWVAKALFDLNPRRTHRRVWKGGGHAQIEVRGATGRGAQHERLASGLRKSLTTLRGVRWAEINAITGQVMVAFDEERVDVETLLNTVRAVEQAHGTREDDFSWEKPVHPSDNTPVGAAALALAADYVAFSTAVTGRLLRAPRLPRGVRVTMTLLDLQPQLRRHLYARFGPVGTDVVMALTYAGLNGLSQRPISPAIDAVYRVELLAEALSRRAVWNRRQPDLCCTPEALPQQAPRIPPRPGPLPKGPLETWSERLGPGVFAGSLGVWALTREPRRAADTIQAAVPRAARMGRQAYAATAARHLAGRGVVPMDAEAFRRLDRVSAVIIDSEALCLERPQILAAKGEAADVRAVWNDVNRLLSGHAVAELLAGTPVTEGKLWLGRDPRVKHPEPGSLALVLRKNNRRLGTATVGGELAPLAEAIVDAARETGARVLLTEHAVTAELLPRADEVLPAGEPLAAHVRRLQQEGRGVLCVSSEDEALAAADVGVGVVGEGSCTCWSADLLCGPDLTDIWRVLGVAAGARPLSERAVHLAQSATALGVLLALVGGQRGGKTHALAPVHSSALLGLWHGTRAARRATGGRPPAPIMHVPWHALEPADVLARLDEAAGERGRGGRLVRSAARQVGASARAVAEAPPARWALAPAKGTYSLGRAVREELEDPLTPVLALGATASAVVGSLLDALLVGWVLSGNAFLSGAQRLRAERSLQQLLVDQTLGAERLSSSSGARSAVDAACQDPAGAVEQLDSVAPEAVPAPSLRPGDVIRLRATDVVPADARLLVACDLEVDESSLTGESVPVRKSVEATPGARLADRSCMVFDGTTVVAGSAYAIVVATGDSTQGARAARAAGQAAPAAGIQARLAEVTRLALPATGVGGAAVAGLGLLRGVPLREAVAAGVSVAVAAVPEGLPLVATVAQAGAARRLSRQGVLVRSSRTLEALGRVDTVCFDKTGTLTEGRLRVEEVAPVASAADAEPRDDQDPDNQDPMVRRILAVAARACPAVADEDVDDVPHTTDRAVLEAAIEAAESAEGNGWQLRCESSFEANRGYSAAHGLDGDAPLLAVKGAPESVLERCTTVAGPPEGDRSEPLDDDLRRLVGEQVERLAGAGLRVLAVAERRTELPEEPESLEPLIDDLTLLGFIGIADSPRESAAHAVEQMIAAGIRPVMITGDHPDTAAAIARAVGLPADHVVVGDELDGITEQDRVRLASEATVFARVSPEQKVRIVEALRAAGRVVMMTGDGTNDAAAIRLADVGIGVGAESSSAARSAADLVLAEPDLPRIHDALVEGRAMWHRLRESVAILVGGNAGEMAFMTLGTALAGRAPINIRQMLLVNLLTDMLPALAVAVAPLRDAEEAAAPVDSTLGSALGRAVVVRGSTTALGAMLAWNIGRYTGRGRRADSMGLAALVGTQLGQTLLVGRRSPLVVATVAASVGALFVIIETPGVSQLFGCTPLGPVAWVVVGGSSAVGTLVAAYAPKVVNRS